MANVTRHTSYVTPNCRGGVTLAYDDTHPHEVCLVFPAGIRWAFARTLLADGFRAYYGHAAGTGDVLTWTDRLWYYLLLSNGTESQTVRILLAQVRRFYQDTLRLVPAGAGGERYDAELDTDLLLLSIEENR